MRLVTFAATATAIALSAGMALAQVGPAPGPGVAPPMGNGLNGPGAIPQAPQHVPAVDPFSQPDVSKITGTAVYGSDDKKIGSVSTVLMNSQGKTIDRLVVAEGGVLGVGAHHVALPVDQFHWNQKDEGFKIDKTADQLKSMAEWRAPGQANAAATAGSGSSVPGGAYRAPAVNGDPRAVPPH